MRKISKMQMQIRGCVAFIFMAAIFMLLGCESTPLKTSEQNHEFSASADQTDLQKRASIRLQLAVSYYEQGQMQFALDEIKQALQARPDFADAYGVKALINMGMGEMKLAQENFSLALKLAPGNPELMNNYGWFLCQTGQEVLSIAQFESAIKNPSYSSPTKALNNAGMCSLKLKNRPAAERYFLQAFQYDSANSVTNINLAKIYYDASDYTRARFYVDRVIKMDILSADVLWLAIRIERKLGDQAAEASLVTQLFRRYPNSSEYAAFQRGAFDE